MLTMIGKRLMFAIPSLIGVVIVTFLLTRALPGDPAAYFAGPAATKEAVELYMRKLRPDGVLCVHVSNRHLDLVPVVADIAAAIKLPQYKVVEAQP